MTDTKDRYVAPTHIKCCQNIENFCLGATSEFYSHVVKRFVDVRLRSACWQAMRLEERGATGFFPTE